MSTTRKKKYSTNPTHLQFYRQYATYQGMFDLYPQNELSLEDTFSKAILYVMDWFKQRVGEEQLDTISEVAFLNQQYPEVTAYKDFCVLKVENINISTVLDVKSLYWEARNIWSFRLIEPDNRTDISSGRGRVFETNVSITQLEQTVAVAVCVICKEPSGNIEDATVYRPAFMRQMFLDADFHITEYGLPEQYRYQPYEIPLILRKNKKRKQRIACCKKFKKTKDVSVRCAKAKMRLLAKPIFLNGKSSQECKEFFENMILNANRKMPVVFCSQDIYEKQMKKIDSLAIQMVGFAHIVVIENSPWKLFKNTMNNDEYAQRMEKGDLILYNNSECFDIENIHTYFDISASYEEARVAWKTLQDTCKNYPLRKPYHFTPCEFYAKAWEQYRIEQIHHSAGAGCDAEELEEWKQKVKTIEVQLEESKRDASILQQKNDKLLEDIKETKKRKDSLKAEWHNVNSELRKLQKELDDLKGNATEDETDASNHLDDEKEKTVTGLSEKEKFKPLLNLPVSFTTDKSAIIDWIETYYSDTLILHKQAKSSYEKSNKKPDLELFCHMIHYLSGYTRYRNNGGMALEPLAARDYDPLDRGITVEPSSSGSTGASSMYSDKYTINIHEFDPKENNVTMDLHLKKGKGNDENMIRIYFYYDSNIKKSIIGCMQEHLPTRKDPH